MTQTELEALSHFEAVWQRVQKEKRQMSQSDEMFGLEEWMTQLYSYMCLCGRMAQVAYGEARKCLFRMYCQMKKRYAVLQLRWFLVTGDIHFASCETNFASYTPYNLRKLWQSNVKNMEMAEKCNLKDDLELAAEIQALKSELLQQKAGLEQLIGKCLQ